MSEHAQHSAATGQAAPTTATPLRTGTLAQIADRVPVPAYDRSALQPRIIHFGVGGFHRAHQAMYLDRMLSAGEAPGWGICGVGVLPGDREMQRVLSNQDHLYTLVLKHADGRYEGRVVGSIIDYLYAPDDPQTVVARLADPVTKIVSLTITEGGYAIDDVTGRFNPSAAGVAGDLQPGAVPKTVFGLITAALSQRRQAGVSPFTIMSCDNLQGNGALAREAFVSFARELDPALGSWIEREVRFPNSMVDRITPVTTDADRDEVAHRFGIADGWPVVCEPFEQWVLEDSFSSARPPFERVGVQVVSDVAPYELMKLRLLNASHQALCYFAALCDYTYVHQAMADPRIRALLVGYMEHEGTPSLDPVPGVDLAAYRSTLIERFSNPEIRDTVARLCAESSDRIPKWLLPVVRYQLGHDGPIQRSAAVGASWARYAEGVDEHGQPIDIVDRRRDQLIERARRQTTEPTAFIDNEELFGDLGKNFRFVQAFTAALGSIHQTGAGRTLDHLTADGDQGLPG